MSGARKSNQLQNFQYAQLNGNQIAVLQSIQAKINGQKSTLPSQQPSLENSKLPRPQQQVAQSFHFQCTHDPNIIHTKKVKKELGSGAYGVAYQVEDDKSGKINVLKAPLNSETRQKFESSVASELESPVHMGLKSVKVNGSISLLMNFFEGETLNRFLHRICKGEICLTTDQRIKLSINLLQAMDEQSHDQDILHRDVKLENIIINPETLEVYIIDYGLCIRMNKEQTDHPGSPHYAAPEVFEGKKYDINSDNYSLAIILIMIWGGTEELMKHRTTAIFDKKDIRILKEDIALTTLFMNDHLSLEHQEEIRSLLRRKYSAEQTARGTNKQDIAIFENIRLKRKLDTIEEQKREKICGAHAAALKLKETLSKISKAGNLTDLTQIDNIKKGFLDTLENVDDDPLAIAMLIETLNLHIPSLQDCKTKNGLITEIFNIVDLYKSYYCFFLKTQQESRSDIILNRISSIFVKAKKYPCMLSNIVDLNKKMCSQIKKIETIVSREPTTISHLSNRTKNVDAVKKQADSRSHFNLNASIAHFLGDKKRKASNDEVNKPVSSTSSEDSGHFDPNFREILLKRTLSKSQKTGDLLRNSAYQENGPTLFSPVLQIDDLIDPNQTRQVEISVIGQGQK